LADVLDFLENIKNYAKKLKVSNENRFFYSGKKVARDSTSNLKNVHFLIRMLKI